MVTPPQTMHIVQREEINASTKTPMSVVKFLELVGDKKIGEKNKFKEIEKKNLKRV